jgi:hypothetical protein
MLLAHRNTTYQNNTFNKETNDDYATAVQSNPMVSPVHGREWRGGTSDALQEGKAAPSGTATSESDEPT